jgi:hypothetical protein
MGIESQNVGSILKSVVRKCGRAIKALMPAKATQKQVNARVHQRRLDYQIPNIGWWERG